MSEPADLEALAKRYLDLWQAHLGGIAEDEQTAEIMARTIEMMNAAGTATFAAMAAAGHGDKGEHDADTDSLAGARPRAGGAPAPAPAPGAPDLDLAGIARRLDRLEKRLAALEAGATKGRRRAPKKPRGG